MARSMLPVFASNLKNSIDLIFHPAYPHRAFYFFTACLVTFIIFLIPIFAVICHPCVEEQAKKCRESCQTNCQTRCKNNCEHCKGTCEHMCPGYPFFLRMLLRVAIVILLLGTAAFFYYHVKPPSPSTKYAVVEVVTASTEFPEEAPATASNLVGSAATPASPQLEGQ